MRTLVEGSSSPPSHHSSSGNIESHDDDAIHVPQNQRTPPPRAKLRYKPKHRIALLTRLYIRQRLSFVSRCFSLFLSPSFSLDLPQRIACAWRSQFTVARSLFSS